MTLRILVVVCGMACWLQSGPALAAGAEECSQLHGKGAELSSDFPPYQVELKLFACAGMTQDVAALDALDHDMLVARARRMPLEELRQQETLTDHPRKYSALTTASRLARLKELVDAYYGGGKHGISRAGGILLPTSGISPAGAVNSGVFLA